MTEAVQQWKVDHASELAARSVKRPKWVRKIKQLQIETSPKMVEVKKTRDIMADRCRRIRGKATRKSRDALDDNEFAIVVNGIWDGVFEGVPGAERGGWTALDYSKVNPHKLMCGLIFLYAVFKTVRGGSSMRNVKWKDIRFDAFGKSVYLNPIAKNNGADTTEDKGRILYAHPQGKGVLEMLQVKCLVFLLHAML